MWQSPHSKKTTTDKRSVCLIYCTLSIGGHKAVTEETLEHGS